MKDSPLKIKSFKFSEDILDICIELKRIKYDYNTTKQLQRAGTAIGALIREAEFAQSKADFINKLSIALKEANETDYWFSLLLSKGIVNSDKDRKTYNELREIIYLLIASVNTAKRNLKNEIKK